MIAAQRDKRLLSGVSARTVNLDLIAIRAVFKKCVEDGIIVKNPMDKLVKLKQGEARERKFLRPAQLQSLLDEAALSQVRAAKAPSPRATVRVPVPDDDVPASPALERRRSADPRRTRRRSR